MTGRRSPATVLAWTAGRRCDGWPGCPPWRSTGCWGGGRRRPARPAGPRRHPGRPARVPAAGPARGGADRRPGRRPDLAAPAPAGRVRPQHLPLSAQLPAQRVRLRPRVAIWTLAAYASRPVSMLGCATVLATWLTQWLTGSAPTSATRAGRPSCTCCSGPARSGPGGRFARRVRAAHAAELVAQAERLERDRELEAQRAVAASGPGSPANYRRHRPPPQRDGHPGRRRPPPAGRRPGADPGRLGRCSGAALGTTAAVVVPSPRAVATRYSPGDRSHPYLIEPGQPDLESQSRHGAWIRTTRQPDPAADDERDAKHAGDPFPRRHAPGRGRSTEDVPGLPPGQGVSAGSGWSAGR
jgi:hypothetical protein